MTNEIRNFKGKVIYKKGKSINKTSREKWYHFSVNTWLFLGGLILLNVGSFVKPDLVDSIFRLLDIRLWKWWYFVFLALLIAFSVKWFFMSSNWKNYDETEIDASKRFNRMAITIIIVMAILVLLNVNRWFHIFSYPLGRWLGYGAFSWLAISSFTLILVAIVSVIYFVWEWIVTFWNE